MFDYRARECCCHEPSASVFLLDTIVFDKVRLLGSAEYGHVMDMFDIGRFCFICVVERLWFGFEVKWGSIKAGLAK